MTVEITLPGICISRLTDKPPKTSTYRNENKRKSSTAIPPLCEQAQWHVHSVLIKGPPRGQVAAVFFMPAALQVLQSHRSNLWQRCCSTTLNCTAWSKRRFFHSSCPTTCDLPSTKICSHQLKESSQHGCHCLSSSPSWHRLDQKEERRKFYRISSFQQPQVSCECQVGSHFCARKAPPPVRFHTRLKTACGSLEVCCLNLCVMSVATLTTL